MPKLYDLQELVDLTELPERTVRYYLAKVLEAPGGTRGRKAFYPQETLDQLKLAKRILMGPYDPKHGEVKPSLRDFQQWLRSHSAEEIREMAELPYRIKPKVLMAVSAPQSMSAVEEELHDFSISKSESISRHHGKEGRNTNKDSAAQYLDRVMGTKQKAHSRPAEQLRRERPWRRFHFGNDLEIKVRKRLTPTQKQQLKLAGQLLQSMLEKE